MRRRLAVLAACALTATPALALDLPARKAGLWELTMTFPGQHIPAQTVKQCVDAATDRLMNSSFGGQAQRNCSKQDMHSSGGTITVDSVCSFAGATTTSHAVITGSFDSAYTMEVTSTRRGGPQIPGMPAGGTTHMTVSAKWRGPCAKGERPGDIMMGNGMTINVLDLRKAHAMPKLPQR
jgi:Protein of unknown function (DUF3617)